MLFYPQERRKDETMQEWIYAAQKLIEYIENHICEKPSLSEISKHIGYSPCYCSEQFHRLAGMTIREYVFRRRLAMAVVDLRDTDISIIDIALQYGFSDQSTFTRAFKYAYGCAPSEYRKKPRPLPLACKKMLLEPFLNKNDGGSSMSISKPYVRVDT